MIEINDIHEKSLSMINDWLNNMSDEELLKIHHSAEKKHRAYHR